MKGIAELKENEIPEILNSPQTTPTDDASFISGLKIYGVINLRVVGES